METQTLCSPRESFCSVKCHRCILPTLVPCSLAGTRVARCCCVVREGAETPMGHYVGCKRHLGYPWRSRGHPSFNGAQALVTRCPSSCGFKMSQSCSTSSYQGNRVFCLFLVFGFFWGLFLGCRWVLSAHPQSTSTWRCSQGCFVPTGIASASKMSAKPY